MLLRVRMTFNGPVSIDPGELQQGELFGGTIHADTLYSAIINQWIRIVPNLPIDKFVIQSNEGSAPFLLSSAFPFLFDEYFLPVPYGNSDLFADKLKDIFFLEFYDFLELSNGNYDYFKNREIQDPLNELIKPFINPRVTIDRMSSATNIYQISGFKTIAGGGLYFLVHLKETQHLETLRLSIQLLGESGIGAEKSSGFGQFEAEIEELGDQAWLNLLTNTNSSPGHYCNLATCCPANMDEAKQAVSYQIVSRKGWISSNSSPLQLKRRACKMFAEGSIFSKPIYGKIVDVTPNEFISEHHVYRYGLNMPVKLSVLE